MKVMFSMAIGIADSQTKKPIADLDTDELFMKRNDKKRFKPTLTHLVNEVIRRKITINDYSKTKKQGRKDKFMEWLTGNPITKSEDVLFIKKKIDSIRRLFVRADATNAKLDSRNLRWVGAAPHIRFMHCYIPLDHMRLLFIDFQQCQTKDQLDGRNNPETKQQDFWEQVVQLFNDPTFNPTSYVFPFLHDDYAKPIDISWKAVSGMGVLTREKAYTKYLGHSAALSKVRSNYELSGNGEGNRTKGDSDENRTGEELAIGGGDWKLNYLGVHQPYILYFWQICEQFQFEKRIVQKIEGKYALDNGNIPSVSKSSDKKPRNNKRKAEETALKEAREKDDAFLQELKQSITATNVELGQHRLIAMKAERNKIAEQLFEAEVVEIELTEGKGSTARVGIQKRKIAYLKATMKSQDKEISDFTLASGVLKRNNGGGAGGKSITSDDSSDDGSDSD
jgi:hypothetical protein